MARYFFNLLVGGRSIPDPEGQEFGSLEEALSVAELSMCEIAADRLRTGDLVDLEAILITDPDEHSLARLSTKDAVLSRFRSFLRLNG